MSRPWSRPETPWTRFEAQGYRETRASAGRPRDGPDDVELLRLAGLAGVETGGEDAVEQLRRVTELRPDDATPGATWATRWPPRGVPRRRRGLRRRSSSTRPTSGAHLARACHLRQPAGGRGRLLPRAGGGARRGRMSTATISLVDMYRALGQPRRHSPRPAGRRGRARRRRRRARRRGAQPRPRAAGRGGRRLRARARDRRPARSRGLRPARHDRGRDAAGEAGTRALELAQRGRGARPPRPHDRRVRVPRAQLGQGGPGEEPSADARGGRCRAARRRRPPPPRCTARTGACDVGGASVAEVATPSRAVSAEWRRCPSCEAFVYHKRLKRNLGVCPECNHHFRLRSRERLAQLLDEDSFEERQRRPRAGRRARRSPTASPTPSASPQAQRKTGSTPGRSTGRERSTATPSWSPASTSTSSAAAWAARSARRSRAPPSSRSSRARRCWSSRPRAARACRRAASR